MDQPAEIVPSTAAEALAELAEEARKAPKCRCGNRCDQPFGDGVRCLPCASRPTQATMQMVLR